MKAEDTDPNLLLVDWLVHSYLYYIREESVITDHEFDAICRNIRDRFDSITLHHKSLLDRETSGNFKSGFYLKASDYPTVVRACAEAMLRGEMQPRRYLD